MLELTPREVKLFITNALRIRKIPYVAGPPAIGKSDIFFQIADDFNLMLLDVRLSQKLPEDLTGLPQMNMKTGKAEYIPFDTFPMEGDKIPDGYSGWLVFLDELSSASDEVWSAIYSLLLGHVVGGRRLHNKALICAAGNRATDSALARPLPDTLITRLLCCNMKVSVSDWLIWADDPVNKINAAIRDFISKNPDMLMSQISASDREELESYGSPRGWEAASKLTNLHEKISMSSLSEKEILESKTKSKPITEDISYGLTSAVGFMEQKAFTEFFNEQMTIPKPWEVAQSASSIRIPTAAIARSELTEDLVKFFIESGAQSREALLLYMNRNNAEDRAVFCSLIKKALGETVSDLALIKDINKRLTVTINSEPQSSGAGSAPPVVNLGGVVMSVQDDGSSIISSELNTQGAKASIIVSEFNTQEVKTS